MINEETPYVFILGCERSGSTWLSNILDSHPDTELLMEPFAEYANFFPGFPGRNIYITNKNHGAEKILRDNFSNVIKHKHALFYQRGKNLFWKKLDRLTVYLFSKVSMFKYLNTITMRFNLLNMNQADLPTRFHSKKNKKIKLMITKELRLNFKIKILKNIFQQAKCIIIVRHPGAQVASILKLFKSGNLKELNIAMKTFFADSSGSERFKKYHTYIINIETKGDIQDMLLLWWLINYETLIEDCKVYGLNYKLIYHEDISREPSNVSKQLFSFLNITYCKNVKAYIKHSATGNNNKSSNKSPIDTTRESAKYSKDTIASIDKNILNSLKKLYEHVNVIDELKMYNNYSQSNRSYK